MSDQENILEVRDLKISFRTDNGMVQAVRKVSFDLRKGETLAIVGESGSGKSVTARAIMGLSAVNSVTENGEIFFEGKDLLRFSENDFQQIRGNRIAMIMQDPMSSLNPIVKIGQQLTEAMILKNRVDRKRNAATLKNMFRELKKCVNLRNDQGFAKRVKKRVSFFKMLEYRNVKRISAYLLAKESLEDALEKANNLLVAIEKKPEKVLKKGTGEILKRVKHGLNQDLLSADDSRVKHLMILLEGGAGGKTTIDLIRDLRDRISEALQTPIPDFLALSYLAIVKGDPTHPRERLEKEFLGEFREMLIEMCTISHKRSLEAQKKAERTLEKFISTSDAPLDKEAKSILKEVKEQVKEAFDPLAVACEDREHAYLVTLNEFVKQYRLSQKSNAKEQKRFARQSTRRERAAQKGRNPDFKVAPAALVDLEALKEKFKANTAHLIEYYKQPDAGEGDFDAKERVQTLIDYFERRAYDSVYRVSSLTAKRRAIRLMEEVGIPNPEKRYRQYPFQMSGGQRQRIVIAIALATDPDILICDEPTTALDVTIQAQILELINKLKEERGLSIIFITHDLGVVANIADRIAVMYAGKIVEYGTAEDLFYSPAHPYTWALLSSMPDLESKDKLEAIPGTPPNMIYPPKGDAFAERNRYALEIDFREEPPMFSISETHSAATWLLHPLAPKVEIPQDVRDRIARMKRQAEGGENK